MAEERYTGRDLTLLIPTKDRPDRVRNLLESLVGQSEICGRVIVIDGGESIEDVVHSFELKLPVEYYTCQPPGQIRQRKLGMSKLTEKDKLVGFSDDDMIYQPGAIEAMIGLWNRVEPETAGIGFNIINPRPFQDGLVFRLLWMNTGTPGVVLKSGANTWIDNLEADTRTQWLGGGYTVWRREILDEFPQENLNTRWAIGEDLRMTYPISKKYPLYVSAQAKVFHDFIHDQGTPDEVYRYRGLKSTAHCLYFAASHPEISMAACLYMCLGSAAFRIVYGLIKKDPSKWKFARGQFDAVGQYMKKGQQGALEALED